ncbi:MAG: hypothetical protein K9G26_07755 [Emcibacter sp.]|nr:hypothetical protein [Emcibacter sp.]
MLRKLVIAIVGLSVVSLSAMAEEDKLVDALQKYEKTGKVGNCISIHQIKTSQVIDDYNILFIMNGSKAYLNTMKHRCSRLGFEKAFSYKISTSQLCDVDIITVFDSSGGIQGPSCGLGKFIEYKEKKKTKE